MIDVFWTHSKGRQYLVSKEEPENEWLGFYDGVQIAVRRLRWPCWRRVTECALPFDEAQDFIKTVILAQTYDLDSRVFVRSIDDKLVYPNQTIGE